MGLITSYNLRSMIVRKGTAAMTASGIAMVVAVFVMTLAIAQGFRATLVASGSPQNAIVLRKSATAETTERRVQARRADRGSAAAGGARRGRPSAGVARAASRSSRCRGISDNQPANVPRARRRDRRRSRSATG